MKKLGIKKLMNILSMVGEISTVKKFNHKLSDKVTDYFKDELNSAKILKKEWGDHWKQSSPSMYPLNLNQDKTWRTYESCTSLTFHISKNNKLICEARVYEGNLLDGHRTELRFKAEIILPNSFVKDLEEDIDYALNEHVADLHELYLKQQAKEWRAKAKADILKVM